MLKRALAKVLGCLRQGGRGMRQTGSGDERPARPPMTPEEAYRKRLAKRKRKAQKSARRRNRR